MAGFRVTSRGIVEGAKLPVAQLPSTVVSASSRSGDSAPSAVTQSGSGIGTFLGAASWGSGHVYRNGGAYQDGLFYIDGFTDASGNASAPLTYTKLFGGSATKTGPGNFDAHWASVTHKGSGEAGLFIGDVTGDAAGSGGNLWGGHFRLTDNWASGGSYLRGLLLELIPNVQNTKSSIAFQALNNGDVAAVGNTNSTTALTLTSGTLQNNQQIVGAGIPQGTTVASGGGTNNIVMSAAATATATGVALLGQWVLNNGVRVAGAFTDSLIIYTDSAGTIPAFFIDQFGNASVGGNVNPIASSTKNLGNVGARWSALFVNALLLNGADTAGTSVALNMTNAAAIPSRANTNGGSVYIQGGRLMYQGTGGAGATPVTVALSGGFPGAATLQAGAGTGATASYGTGTNDDAGTCTVTLGTSPAAGALVKVNLGVLLAAGPRAVILTPASSGAQAAGLYVTAAGTGGFMVNCTNIPAGSIVFSYEVRA